jgi:hypothetical protein
MSEARIAHQEPKGSLQLEFCMLKFLAAAALIGAALLADGTQAQAGLFRHHGKKCKAAPTPCCSAQPTSYYPGQPAQYYSGQPTYYSPQPNGVFVAPAPMVMPRR